MPNANYLAGTRLERKRRLYWMGQGYKVIRASGSHGFADLVCFKTESPVVAIQCKVVQTAKAAQRLLDSFSDLPPFPPWEVTFTQRLEVYCRENRRLYVAQHGEEPTI